ncbi:MAG: hypothetical protein IJ168_02420 [Eubacterium sp.]|nr:hypothetical protein [Eubacterium sp.]
MFDGNSKKLILVGDEKTDVYCELMSMLISSKDDEIDEEGNVKKIIGIMDGSVDSAIWTSDIYKDNRAHTSSKQKLLFIGETQASKNIIPNLIIKDNDAESYGVNIGWLGNKAVITVDPQSITKSGDHEHLYNHFFKNYQTLSRKFKNHINNHAKAIEALQKKQSDSLNKAGNTASAVFATTGAATGIGTAVGGASAASAAASGIAGVVMSEGVFLASASLLTAAVPPLMLLSAVAFIVPKAINFKKGKDVEKELTKQMYEYAVLKFYFDYLASFMEM